MILARIQIATLVLATAVVACHGRFAEPRDPCDGVDCSGHGECVLVDEGSRAACVCDDGFDDDGLACVPIGGDGDADVDTDADSDPDNESCIPDCGDRECGADPVCGTLSCGECDETHRCTEEGRCGCITDCEGRECGGDGCGGYCPPGCGIDEICDDGICSPVCGVNAGFGNGCIDVSVCDDDSPCESVIGLEAYGSLCLAFCSSDDDCPDIAPGSEICLMSFCLVECDSAWDCSCGLECRGSPVGTFCYP